MQTARQKSSTQAGLIEAAAHALQNLCLGSCGRAALAPEALRPGASSLVPRATAGATHGPSFLRGRAARGAGGDRGCSWNRSRAQEEAGGSEMPQSGDLCAGRPDLSLWLQTPSLGPAAVPGAQKPRAAPSSSLRTARPGSSLGRGGAGQAASGHSSGMGAAWSLVRGAAGPGVRAAVLRPARGPVLLRHLLLGPGRPELAAVPWGPGRRWAPAALRPAPHFLCTGAGLAPFSAAAEHCGGSCAAAVAPEAEPHDMAAARPEPEPEPALDGAPARAGRRRKRQVLRKGGREEGRTSPGPPSGSGGCGRPIPIPIPCVPGRRRGRTGHVRAAEPRAAAGVTSSHRPLPRGREREAGPGQPGLYGNWRPGLCREPAQTRPAGGSFGPCSAGYWGAPSDSRGKARPSCAWLEAFLFPFLARVEWVGRAVECGVDLLNQAEVNVKSIRRPLHISHLPLISVAFQSMLLPPGIVQF